MEHESFRQRDERNVSFDGRAPLDPDAIARAQQRTHRDAARTDLERTGREPPLEPASFARAREERGEIASAVVGKRGAHACAEAAGGGGELGCIPNA